MRALSSEPQKPQLHLVPQHAAWPEPPVLGERLWRFLERGFQTLERAVDRGLPETVNPFVQTGAVAVVTFLIAAASGVLLLFWYSPSVNQAYASVVEMGQAPFTAGLLRSVHRYSADGCLLFVGLHALRLFVARRYGGTRKLAWITGIVLVVSLWGVGWAGYWLVWDARAQQVALGTARLMDVLPIFADPLSRSFLTDRHVNSLLFFVVFFAHMLLPLGMGIPLWLHLTRLSRPRFFTHLPLTVAILVSLVALSLLLPADLAQPAQMAVSPRNFGIDAWYLVPLVWTDRLGAGALWAMGLFGTGFLISFPWWMTRGKAAAAKVNVTACNGCELCYEDCPYDAIRMVPRTDERNFARQAEVDPDRCVGCGICAGSCDPGAIGLPSLPVQSVRRQVERWIDEELRGGGAPYAAFLCTASAGGALEVDREGRCAALPNYRVFQVPCAGWVHMLGIERALKKGARGVLIASCGPGEVMYREGARWTEHRLSGERKPALRAQKIDAAKVRSIHVSADAPGALIAEARRFAEGLPRAELHRPLWKRGVAGGVVLTVLVGLVAWGSRVAYAGPPEVTELVVSFKHPGQAGQRCHKLSEEEKAQLPPHMRQDQVCDRGRADVRLKVEVDGAPRLEKAFAPHGLARDGNSIAVERLPVTPGRHVVRVSIGDSGKEGDFPYTSEQVIQVKEGTRAVVLFDRVDGFEWD